MSDTRALREDERAAWNRHLDSHLVEHPDPEVEEALKSDMQTAFIAGLRYRDEAGPSEAEVAAAARVMYERDGRVCQRAFETGEVKVRWDDLGVVERKAWKTKARYVLIAARKASQ